MANSLLVTAADSMSTSYQIQYEILEVTNPDELIAMACQGMDEFSEDTGLSFNMEGEMATVDNNSNPFGLH